MILTEIRVRAVRVPMPHPHRTASGTVTESPLVLTDITTSDGVTGRSIVFTYTAALLRPTTDLVVNLGELLHGDVLSPVIIHDQLNARFRLAGTQGLTGTAIAAIDMALWDALARTLNVPLATALGGVPGRVQAYGAIGFDGAHGSAETAAEWARRGLKGVKAKIGYTTVEEDLQVIRAIRSAAGPEMAIMVDYNQSLAPADAVVRLRRLDDEGLTWIEEPTHSHHFAGHAAIARETRTPIQAGENWWGPLDVRHAIDADASDYIMLDAMKIGGVTGWTRAASMAAAHEMRISNHLWPEWSAQMLSVTPGAHWLEYADWWNPILNEPLALQNGYGVASTKPGSGIEWNEEAVDRFGA
jgi:mandelate racemase